MPRTKQKPKTRRATPQRKKTSRLKLLNRSSFTPKRVLAIALAFALVGAIIISQSRAGVVEDYTFAGQATKGLDASGKTLPSFNYSVPTSGRVIYMAPADKGGKDTNDGFALDRPVESIGRAYTQLKSGGNASGTIVLRGGEYRSWYSTDGKIAAFMKDGNITFQAYRSEKPWFVGTDPVKDGWAQASTGVWKRPWSTPNFCSSHTSVKAGTNYRTKVPRLDGAMVSPVTVGTSDRVTPYTAQSGMSMSAPRVCGYPDNYYTRNGFTIDSDPQLAVVNGTQIPQKRTLAELSTSPNSFYYDWDNETIYINKDPNANNVELAKRKEIAVFAGATTFQWKGIGVKHFASSPLHPVIYAGLGDAINPNGGELIVENSVFTENAAGTIGLSGPKLRSAIKRSVFANNGYTGFGANGFASSAEGAPNALLIDSSIFNNNNTGNFDVACAASCGAAAVKLNNMTGYTAKNSIFENTQGYGGGLWCDIDCSNAVMVNNISRNNGGPGIFYEISSKGIIANNLIYDNRTFGISVFASTTKVYNNTIINRDNGTGEATQVADDDRAAPDNGETWPYSSTEEQAAAYKVCAAASLQPTCTIGSPGPNTNGVEFMNNLIVGQRTPGARLNNFGNNRLPFPPNTVAKDYFAANKLGYNAYYHRSDSRLYNWASTDQIRSPLELQSVSGNSSLERESFQITSTTGPDPFIDRNAHDFRLKTSSDAYAKKGVVLPSDVAAAIGLTTNTTAPARGVIYANDSTPPPAPTDTTAPIGPTSLTAAPASTSQINLSWPAATDPESGIKEYAILRNNSSYKTVSANTLSFSDTGLPASTSYSYQVKAVNNVGLTSTGSPVVSAKTNTATTTPPPAPTDTTGPTPPGNLTRSLRTDWSIFRYVLDLKWAASQDNVGGTGVKEYQIKRDGQLIGKTGANVTTFSDKTLSPDITYSYTVTALDNAPTPNPSLPSAVTARASCFLIWCSLQ